MYIHHVHTVELTTLMSLICYYMYNIQCIVNSLRVCAGYEFTRQCTRACKWLVHGTCVCIDNKLDSSYTNALSDLIKYFPIFKYEGTMIYFN